MKNRIWPVVFSLVFLASCQSSRFMQDDMYFNAVDAKREVRQFEVAQWEKKNAALKTDQPIQPEDVSSIPVINTDDYYDYSYSSRIRRFNYPNNSWAYYDPYYTNYYWFNNAKSEYFGNSVYSTYSWWGPNFGNNYNSNHWEKDSYDGSIAKKGWTNPWRNNLDKNKGSNPYNPFANNGWNSPSNNSSVSWNNKFCFNNMYYNSLDNNCYWWWWKKGNAPVAKGINNFVALMQSNGISNDVVKRPDINYIAIKESYYIAITNEQNRIDSTESNLDVAESNTNENTVLSSNNARNLSNRSKTLNKSQNTTNTSKRWDNHNADVNISPNTNTNSNLSRSGVFSEGSRDNNYEFKGTVITKKGTQNSNNNDQQKEKDPKK